MKIDLTVVAIPAYVGAMVAEYRWQRRHPVSDGSRAGDYQLADTLASLSMGFGSLVAPFVAEKLLDPITPGVGRHARLLVGAAVVTTVATTAQDIWRRRRDAGSLPAAGVAPGFADTDRPDQPVGLQLAGVLAVSAVATTALTVATTWAAQITGRRLFERSRYDLGGGPLGLVVGVLGWDFLYYWDHRLSHECRWLWAVHVVHHSSERYNLSTALRQPVAENITMLAPYGLVALLGVRPGLIMQARALDLMYQFWIHTEAIDTIGPLERWLNTPSHHRVHHGSNRRYLDRNHGGILIIWDRLFGTFEPEGERPVYGLTRNIDTVNPVRIAGHEWLDLAGDIAGAATWRDRWSYLLRGPGWAYERRAIAGRG
ncbi:sterol desaturase family protein [Skermania piniformis]|uniref:Sterol desaturase family protein n=1 Tax=Skermania pinensis TaxID=39122 RepID=A0ABX8S6Z6_9ACTN|nr:sterol desaturase family protein [Skermania piniformis]QXQ13241.1 sterol desaturase family protein [Skermania piniformis]